MTKNKIAFVIGCVDCRHHKAEAEMISQLEAFLGVSDIYLFTLAGPDGQMLKQGNGFASALEDAVTIKQAKGASVFAVLGHYQCAGHNVSDAEHDTDTEKAAMLLSERTGDQWLPLILCPEAGVQGPTWSVKGVAANNELDAVAA